MTLYPHQSEAIAAIRAAWSEHKRLLCVAPTGSGKSRIFTEIIAAEPGRSLLLCHRDELIGQAVRHLNGLSPAVEQADSRADRDARVVVASVATMRGSRLGSWPNNHFDLVVVDEAHHAAAGTWKAVLDHFHCRALGLTATPHRGDRKSLAAVWYGVAHETRMEDLIAQGYLCPISVQTVPLEIDVAGAYKNGDYADGDVADALRPYLARAADEIAARAADRKTLIFLPLVSTSKDFASMLRARGLAAEAIWGEDPERSQKLAALRDSRITHVCNSQLLTEGFDQPDISCIVPLRPYASQPAYAQAVGRGTRIAPGKRDLLLLDFLWLSAQHRLCRPAHLIATSDDEARTMVEIGDGDLLTVARDARRQREEKLARELARQRRREADAMPPMELGLLLHRDDIADYQPTFRWQSMPAGPKQLGLISRFRIDTALVRDRGHASLLIDALLGRSKCKMATPHQMRWLARKGHQDPSKATAAEAKIFLDQAFTKGR